MYKSDGRAISKREPYTEAPNSGQSQSPYRFTVPLTIEEEGCVMYLESERGSLTWKTIAVSLGTSPQSLGSCPLVHCETWFWNLKDLNLNFDTVYPAGEIWASMVCFLSLCLVHFL